MSFDALPQIAGIRVPGSGSNGSGEAAPSSLIAKLRATAQEKRESEELLVDLPGRWKGILRVRYGTLDLSTMERFAKSNHQSNIAVSLDMLTKACRAIEGLDVDGEWKALEDDVGPVTFDDRLTRLLKWDRPDDEFTFPVQSVWEAMFDGNGFAIGQHVAKVAEWMGAVEESATAGEA